MFTLCRRATSRFSTMELNARIPSGPLAAKWDSHQFANKLVNPANRRKFSVIVVGTGLAGAPLDRFVNTCADKFAGKVARIRFARG